MNQQRRSDTSSSIDLWDDTSIQNENDSTDMFKEGFTSLVGQLQEKQACILKLENEIASLKEEKLKQDYQNNITVARLKDEIRTLEKKAEFDIIELKRRQNQIETEVPSLGEQLKSIKAVLHDLNISDTLYSEIISIPKESRTIREHILVLAYEKMSSYRNDIETLRQERDVSREALSMANAEVQKLRRDTQKNAIEQESRDRDVEEIMTRNQRLEIELRDANLQIEIFSAKSSLYDEVKSNIIKMEEILLSKEQEQATLLKNIQDFANEKQKYEEALKYKEHCVELLEKDKAYLNGLIKAQEDQLLKADAEKRKYENRLKELEQAQKSFYDQILHSDKSTYANLDQCLHDEKRQMQERNKQELELMRIQLSEAAEFEIQMLRRTRDVAVGEYENLQAILKESRKENDELLKRIQTLSLQRGTGEKNGYKLESELLKKHEETCQMLCQSKTENELLLKKIDILSRKNAALEIDVEKNMADWKLKLESANANLKKYQEEEQLLNNIVSSAFEVLMDACEETRPSETQLEYTKMIHRRLDVVCMVIKSCKKFQDKVKVLEREKERLQQMIEVEQMKNEMVRKFNCMEKPISSTSTETAERKLIEVVQQKELLEIKLREAVEGKEKAHRSLNGLKANLKRLLQARGNIDSLQKLLMENDLALGTIVSERITNIRQSSSCLANPICL